MKKYLFLCVLIIFVLLIASFKGNGVNKQLEPEKKNIRKIFSDWQVQQIKSHRFWAKDSCNIEFMSKHSFNGTIPEGWGFPDSSEIKFSFADINRDGQLDGLIVFTPKQCDGGNGSMYEQIQILVVSNKNKYDIQENLSSGFVACFGKERGGFYWLDSIAPNQIFGTYLQYQKDDGRMPSVEKRIVIYYDSKKMEFINPKK